MLRTLVRWLGESLVRVYYPDLTVVGAENLPAGGPAVFVLNHPNGLLDPLVLRVAIGRPVRFLAKGTLFANPLGRLAMAAFGSVPVHRAQDAGPGIPGPGDPPVRDRDRAAANEAAFARCRALLGQGEAIALFPEGVSHSDPQMRPLRSGAARILLEGGPAGAPSGVQVIPVGLWYERKAIFRSRVVLTVGRPVAIAPGATIDGLTDALRGALDEVVLQAETRDLLDGIARVAVWTAPQAAATAAGIDPAERHRRARELLAAYKALRQRAPDEVEAIVRGVRDYARVLRHLGVRDPWALELRPVSVPRALAAVAHLVLAAPVAALGVLLGWLPYRLAGQVAVRVTREEDILSTVKLLSGALFLFVGWAAEALLVGWWQGLAWGAATFVAGPATGYVALRFEELWAAMRESVRNIWLRGAHYDQVRRLSDRRRALADDVARALRSAGELVSASGGQPE